MSGAAGLFWVGAAKALAGVITPTNANAPRTARAARLFNVVEDIASKRLEASLSGKANVALAIQTR